LAVALFLIISAIVIIERPFLGRADVPSSSSQMEEQLRGRTPDDSKETFISVENERALPPIGARDAPDLEGISGWINTDPLTLDELRGKVVLIDFWTYTCVNCIRTFPYLNEWQRKYSDRGLVIIGVHTPEFIFERDKNNVEAAVERFGLTYPVAQDNDYATWQAFNNRYWPAKYLIDANGYIRHQHFGEGAYDEFEEQIRLLLLESGSDVESILAGSDSGPEVAPNAVTPDLELSLTRELYGGYVRNQQQQGFYVFQDEYYAEPGAVVNYKDPGNHRNHFIYLHGMWFNGIESIVHSRTTKAYEDYIALKFYATSVNGVFGAEEGKASKVWITLNGQNLNKSNQGADISIDPDGRSFILVEEARMYYLVKLREIDSHELQISSNEEYFSLFALTFGAYPDRP
jgi:thiol-disulfide isomerase/thioredoxin